MSNALIVKDRSGKPERISKRLKVALNMMVWPDEIGRSVDWYEAARKSKITVESMRKALERPVVRMYLRTQKEVFRAALSTQTLSRLRELGWQDENRNAAVAAIRAIEGQEEQARAPSASEPHVTIKIVNAVNATPAPAPVTIEHEPELTDDPHDPTKQLREPYFRWPRD
jgi:hypothetical protein